MVFLLRQDRWKMQQYVARPPFFQMRRIWGESQKKNTQMEVVDETMVESKNEYDSD